jgi:broad specificity phosphatase PhoE
MDHMEKEYKYGKGSKESKAYDMDKTGFDLPLHPIGIEMCVANQHLVNDVDWKIVYVSPMQRTLQTTIHMFKNHPNKDNIKFVILPIVREVLKKINDIAMDPKTLI